jgi:hypothetical protein
MLYLVETGKSQTGVRSESRWEERKAALNLDGAGLVE